MKLAFVFQRGRSIRIPLVDRQEAPTEFFLGMIELQRAGTDARFHEIDIERPTTGVLGAVGNLVAARGLLPARLTGGALEAVRPLIDELNTSDCVLATTSGLGFALGAWKRCGRLRPPLAVVHCGLLNVQYGRLKKCLTRSLLADSETILYGEAERAPLVSMFPSVAQRTHVCQFGVDTQFWSPSDGPGGSFVLSIGNDGRRDFGSVVEAARLLPGTHFHLITSRPLEGVLPANVELTKGSWSSAAVTDVDLRDIYRQALCVAVVLKDSFQPSGQSVTLQAWACGCPVILTRTSGMWSREMLRDGENVLLVEPDRPEEVADAIRRLAGDVELRRRLSQAGRATVCREAGIDGFARAVMEVCETAVRQAAERRGHGDHR